MYDEREERMCLGKDAYPSEAAADAVIREWRAGRSLIKSYRSYALVAYWCPICGEFHIAHAS